MTIDTIQKIEGGIESLISRTRAGSEAAPWVIEELVRLRDRLRTIGGNVLVVLGDCQHPDALITIGPTTTQRNHHCLACGASWVTFPDEVYR